MNTKQQAQSSKVRSIARAWIYAPVMATSFLVLAQPTLATIDNTATASGLYGLVPVTSVGATVNIPVVTANPVLSVTKTVLTPATIAAGPESSITDAGDTITYQYVIQNNGNVTISAVTPIDAGPSFGNPQTPGTNFLGAFTTLDSTTLLPGATATFTAVYTLSDVDVYRAAGLTIPADAVNNSATATGTPATGTLVAVTPSLATTTIAAGPLLSVSKAGVLDDTNGTVPLQAEVGETITYTYTVFNNGNVAITGIVINDTHEAPPVLPQISFAEGGLVDGPLAPFGTVSSDGPVDGSWDLLQPGATVTFTYVHIVTQAEVDGG